MSLHLTFTDQPPPLAPSHSAMIPAPLDMRGWRPRLPIVCPPGKQLRIRQTKRGMHVEIVDAPAPPPPQPEPQPEPQPDGGVLFVDPTTGDYSPPRSDP